MTNNRGYTLVEIILASVLSMIIMGSTLGFLLYFFTEKSRLESWSTGQVEMSIAIKSIERDIRNVVRLEPAEDFKTLDDSLYFGLSSIPTGEEPSICRNNASSSVLRYTSLLRSVRQEKSVRAWSEYDSAGLTQAENELRVSYDGTDDSLFSDKNVPKEVLVVDADRRFIRRYEVGVRIPHMNSPTDPYDDQLKVDDLNQPVTFNYMSVFLKLPKINSSGSTKKKAAVFVTGSDIYASTTYYICIRDRDGSLIRYSPLDNKEEVLLANNVGGIEVKSLKMTYLATEKGLRVEPAAFEDSTLTAHGICVNSVYVVLEAEAKQNTADGNTDLKTNIQRSRTIFATNLSSRRPLSCIAD